MGCGMNEGGLFLPLAQRGIVPTFSSREQRVSFIDNPLPVLKKVCMSLQPLHSCLPACTLHTVAEFPQKTWGCLSRQIKRDNICVIFVK